MPIRYSTYLKAMPVANGDGIGWSSFEVSSFELSNFADDFGEKPNWTWVTGAETACLVDRILRVEGGCIMLPSIVFKSPCDLMRLEEPWEPGMPTWTQKIHYITWKLNSNVCVQANSNPLRYKAWDVSRRSLELNLPRGSKMIQCVIADYNLPITYFKRLWQTLRLNSCINPYVCSLENRYWW